MLTINLCHCRIDFRFSFFALLAFCGLTAGGGNGAFLLFAVSLHELAHLFFMYRFGALPKRIACSALGFQILLPSAQRLSYGQNAIISLAGPVSNLLAFLLLFLCGWKEPALFQLTLGVVHLLPIEPLDGGLALHSLLCVYMETGRARKWTLFISLVFLFPLAVLGFLLLLRTRYNFSLLALSLYLMLYLVLKRQEPGL